MPELGAKGLAKVLALKPCPEIQAGPGHVVLSTFAHPATHEILDVTIGEGEDVETIGVTETHPFWSVQDQAFVPVGHLVAGSQVLTADEQTKTITSILPRPGPAQQVYNLEVNGEHVYYVGQQQLLVHNDGCFVDVLHATTKSSAEDILKNGLSARKARQANVPGSPYPGSFFTFPVNPSTIGEVSGDAIGMAKRHTYFDDDVVCIIARFKKSDIDRLVRESKLVIEDIGAFAPEYRFTADSFDEINKLIEWIPIK